MKKISTLVSPPLVIAIAFYSGGCRKTVDYNYKAPDSYKTADSYKGSHQVDNKHCNISRITVHTTEKGNGSAVKYTFTYNAAGDPVTVENTAVATGNPNTVFKYDNQSRMVEMIRPYDNGTFETWTKYIYNSGGLIVRDTQYTFGTYIDSTPVARPATYGYWVSQFSYDAQKRVIARTDEVYGSGSSTYTNTTQFQYDANGNLMVDGVTYDSHQNLLRTNKIWMFVCTNYSAGNGFQASAYTNHDLPLSFEGSYGVMGPIVPLDGKYDVHYTCND